MSGLGSPTEPQDEAVQPLAQVVRDRIPPGEDLVSSLRRGLVWSPRPAPSRVARRSATGPAARPKAKGTARAARPLVRDPYAHVVPDSHRPSTRRRWL